MPEQYDVLNKTSLRRRNFLFGMTGTCAAAALFVWERRTRPRVHFWADKIGPIQALTPVFPADFGTKRVFVDPGHGAPNNPGNSSCICQDEQDFTMSVARHVADWLRQTGHFEVRLAREGDEHPTYPMRVEAATNWKADVYLSIHSDIRGETGESQRVGPDKVCKVNLSAPGISVLLSEDGDGSLVAARKTLARSTAKHMREAGFGAYSGTEYGTLYAKDPDESGVFLDRHAYDKRIYVLWKPTMPSILVETHHALDPREVRLWAETSTHEVFASVLAASLIDALAVEPKAL